MFIYYGVNKLVKKRQEKKEAEATGQPIPSSEDQVAKEKRECPNCHEKKKIEFKKQNREDGSMKTTAMCLKCGEQWEYS